MTNGRLFGAIVATLTVLAAPGAGQEPQGIEAVTTFDGGASDRLPGAMRTSKIGDGTDGRWSIVTDPSAPSAPHVLAQLSTDPSSKRFLLAFLDIPVVGNGRAQVRFKTVSGKQDQSAGLAFRIADERNYYVLRANTIEKNLRLYRFVDGVRTLVAGEDFAMNPGEWHQLGVTFDGPRLQCFYDGQRRLDVNDATLPAAGRIGVWTKADSVAHFDDLAVTGR